MRPRHVTADTAEVYKLTQKVRVRLEDPSDLLITNTYLSHEEHRVLSALPSRRIRKIRTVHRSGEHDLVVDVFHGRLHGLRLAEVEVELVSLDGMLSTPVWLGEEITHDDRYSGGALAFAPDDEVQSLLASKYD